MRGVPGLSDPSPPQTHRLGRLGDTSADEIFSLTLIMAFPLFQARRATKAFLRGDTCAAMSEGFAADKAYSLAWISSPKIQEGIGAYIAALKAKKR